MIRIFNITVPDFVRNETPEEMRLAGQVAFFQALVTPLATIESEWRAFRDAAIIRAQVTGETMSLAWYLNYLFDPIDQTITIDTAGPSGVLAGDPIAEPLARVLAGDPATEPLAMVAAGYPGEGTDFEGKSFCVYVPLAIAVTEEAVKDVVNQYKMAGKSYLIKRL